MFLCDVNVFISNLYRIADEQTKVSEVILQLALQFNSDTNEMKIENAIRSDFEAQLPSTGELLKKYEIFERFLGSLFINDSKSTVQKYFRNYKLN